MSLNWTAPAHAYPPRSAQDRRDAALNLPATCDACFALLPPEAKPIAVVIRKLLRGAPMDATWFRPERTPLCQRERTEQEQRQ